MDSKDKAYFFFWMLKDIKIGWHNITISLYVHRIHNLYLYKRENKNEL